MKIIRNMHPYIIKIVKSIELKKIICRLTAPNHTQKHFSRILFVYLPHPVLYIRYVSIFGEVKIINLGILISRRLDEKFKTAVSKILSVSLYQ